MNRFEDLIERTLGDDRRALQSSPSVVEGALIRAGRIRRRRAVVSAVAAVMVIVAGVAIAVPLLNDNGTSKKPGSLISQGPGPDETNNSAPALTSPLFTVTASMTTDLQITSAVVDADSVYVVGNRAPVHGLGTAIAVQRLDRSTLDVLATQAFGGTTGHLALSNGHLWLAVALPPGTDSVTPPPLYELDPATLDIVRHVALPSVASGLAATADGVWVATQDKLIRVNSSGDKVTTSALDGPLTDITSDVTNGVFYTLGQSSTSAQAVTERDLSTGAVVATYDGMGPGAGALSATSDGVWASLPTGMAGGLTFLSRDGLHPTAAPVAGEAPSNQVKGTVAGSIVWVADAQSLACAEVSTGATRATDAYASGHTPAVLGGDTTATYLQHGNGLYSVTPSAVCTG